MRRALTGHDVRTTPEMGRELLANGELLREAGRAGLDVLIAADKNIRRRQNTAGTRIALVAPSTNYWPAMRPHPDRTAPVGGAAGPGSYAAVGFAPRSPRARRPERPGP